MRVEFRNEYYGDEWEELDQAVDNEEEAAEILAEKYWSSDPTEPRTFEFIVDIKSPRGVFKYTVMAEADVNFYARELK